MEFYETKLEAKEVVLCRECGEIFSEWKELGIHRENAHKVFSCKCCLKQETSLVDFEYHLQTHGGVKLFKCIICREDFSYIFELNEHLQSHLPKEDEEEHEFSQSQDTDLKVDDSEPEKEADDHGQENKSVRKDVNDSIIAEPSVEITERRKRGRPAKPKIPFELKERKFQCPQCPLRAKTSSNLKIHMRTHTGEKPFECAICGKCYSQKIALRSHLIMQHDPNKKKTEVCPYCGKSFYFIRRLKNHIREIHKNAGERHACHICGNTYSQRSSMMTHIQNHFKAAGAYSCPDENCNKSFDTRFRMMTHHRQIHRPKNHHCKWESCTFKSKTPAALRAHERTHTGDRPFKCKLCDKYFGSNNSLNAHFAHKHGAPQHQCTICEKSFKVVDSLKKHVARIHLERKFSCDFCEKKFAHNADVKRHKRDSHSVGKRATPGNQE